MQWYKVNAVYKRKVPRLRIGLMIYTTSLAKELISTIFQFDQIDRCSNVLLDLKFYIVRPDDWNEELPVDVVANWLNRSRTSNANGLENERILLVKLHRLYGFRIDNFLEMLNGLKTVSII